MIKLFTDIDLDGLGCGVVAKMAFGEEASVSYCSYRNLNQKVDAFLDDPEEKNTSLYITDLAVNESVEKKLAQRYNEGHPVAVIDHHVTALHFNDYEWGLVKPEDEDGKKTCATSLFYDYLVDKKLMQPHKALEEFIELVRQYDTWEWDENNTLEAKRLNDLFYIMDRTEFEEEMLSRLKENPDAFSLTDMENTLLDIEDQKIDRYIRSKNRQIVQTFIENYCVGIVHAEQYLSELGNELNKLNPHLDMIVLVNAGSKKIGFRTIHDHINVAEFAARFGGGGHPKASGCDLTDETFRLFVANVFPLQPLKPDPEQNKINVKGSPFGTYYQNRKGHVSSILPTEEGHFEVLHEGKRLDKTFPTFEDAERFVKRNYMSWLRYDEDYLRQLAACLPISRDTLEENFDKIMDAILDEVAESE
ncbi:DHH family phosphoesterase [Tuberibacillus calidus]|jgi:oligoribonuclease NrnB/cAMP/cGMP phosphodiesterase (DHH superfamily)|uniref:DHH family phosphoesterase n=1 Tax=Tuberibacillus calidus TaxID=340097 RepID=UPI000416EDA8|nr:oligoribonuclease [Tuberibacillus calidus]